MKIKGFLIGIVFAVASIYGHNMCGQSRVSFHGIPLGISQREFHSRLADLGFHFRKEFTDDGFLVMVTNAYYTGVVDEYPAVLKLEVSPFTKTVYGVELVLQDFLDEVEAAEECKRLLSDEKGRYAHVKEEFRHSCVQFMPLIQTVYETRSRREMNYMVTDMGEIILRIYYDEPEPDSEPSGYISGSVIQILNKNECLAVLRYSDVSLYRQADEDSREGTATKKKALAVFIGNYPEGSGWSRIHASNDKEIVLNRLHEMEFNQSDVVCLEDSAATFSAITSALEGLAETTRKGDNIYIHFAAHGQQITDVDGDEVVNNPKDRYDEAIVPYDAAIAYDWNGYHGERHLTDDILNKYLARISKAAGPDGIVLFVADACHSGDLQRDESNDSLMFRGAIDAFELPVTKHSTPCTTKEETWVTVCACKDFQTNYEVCVDGKIYGRLSYAICQSLGNGMTPSRLGSNLEERYKDLPLPKGRMQSVYYSIPRKLKEKRMFR